MTFIDTLFILSFANKTRGSFFLKKVSGCTPPNCPYSRVIYAVALILVETAIRRDMTWLLTPWFTALISGR